jgi:HSP20 family protein
MSLVRFDPFRSFEGIAKKMNDFMGDFEKGVNIEFGTFSPRVDISEDEKYLYVNAELPGLKKEEVKVTINDDNVLVIKGEKKREESQEEKDENKTFIRVERNYGMFTRSFMLPENLKTDSINAKFENGVLNISLEKVEPQKPKEVEVQIS